MDWYLWGWGAKSKEVIEEIPDSYKNNPRANVQGHSLPKDEQSDDSNNYNRLKLIKYKNS